MVEIETLRGKVTMRAFVTENIARGFIDANHACGSPIGPPEWSETNINTLTDLNQYDIISGFPAYKSLLCQITKTKNMSTCNILNSVEITAEEPLHHH
jgi:anaerobic selenocysteine-containing dehydrogenase